MKTHWPLGKGSHTRSLVHTAIAVGGVLLVLLVATFVAVEGPGEPTVAAGCRFWAGVLFAAVAMQGAILIVFRPGLLRLLLPTPREGSGLYEHLDPNKILVFWAFPFLMGTIAALPVFGNGNLWGIAVLFYACALFRFLLPILTYLAVRLRKLLVPWGHMLVWIAALGTIGGLIAGVPGVGDDVADVPFLLYTRHPGIPFVAGLVLVLLAWPVRKRCARAIAASLRRDELRDYAFPVEGERASAKGRMLVEIASGGAHWRRFVVLLQESFGLHRPADWMKAKLVWLIAFVGLFYWMHGVGGSMAQMVVTLGATFAFFLWCAIRRLRIQDGKLAWRLPGHALPFGVLEVFWTQTFVVSLVYFGTGALSALGLWLVGSPQTAEPLQGEALDVGIAYAALANLTQCWLLLLALLAVTTSAKTPKAWVSKAGVRGFNWIRALAVFSLIMMAWGIAIVALWGLIPLVIAESPWAPILAQGTRIALLAAYGAYLGDPNALNMTLAPLSEGLAPFWPFGAIAWMVPALLAVCSIASVTRSGLGRAHPSYRQDLPSRARLESTGDVAARAVT